MFYLNVSAVPLTNIKFIIIIIIEPKRTSLATPLLLLRDVTAYVKRTSHYLATAVSLPLQFLL
jgi:hypothetical protein